MPPDHGRRTASEALDFSVAPFPYAGIVRIRFWGYNLRRLSSPLPTAYVLRECYAKLKWTQEVFFADWSVFILVPSGLDRPATGDQ